MLLLLLSLSLLLQQPLLLLAAPTEKPCVGLGGGRGEAKEGGEEGNLRREARSFFLAQTCLRRS